MSALFPATAAATAGAALLLWVASVIALRLARTAYLSRGAHTLEIHAPPRTTVDHALAFWTHTLGLLRPRWTHRLVPPHLAWEYVASSDGVRIQIWVPGTVDAHALARAVAADWPGATTRLRRATAAIPQGEHVTGSWQRLARGDQYPLRTGFADDPLRNLFGELSDLTPGQHAVVRVCARPAGPRRAAGARTAAARLRGLGTPLLATGTPFRGGGRTTLYPGTADDVRAILTKAASPRLACQVIVLTSTEHPGRPAAGRLRARAKGITAFLSAYTSGLNGFRRQWTPFPGLWTGRRHLARGSLLSTAELAAIAHLPTDAAVPGLTRAGARRVAPDPRVPRAGRVLGEADAGPRRPVATGIAEARQHTHVIGKTGSGKSTLLARMVLQDAEAGRSALLLDPRGDLVLDVLDRLPKRSVNATVVFDPADPTPPPRLNVLRLGTPEHAADTLTGIFRRIHASSWGPRTEDILRATSLTLARAQDPGLTIGHIPRLLADDAFRAGVLTGQRPDTALDDFWHWYTLQSPQMRAAATDPLLNKLRAILLRPWAASVLASGASTVDLPHLLDHGGLVLMRLPKGRLGEDTASLVGTLVLAAAWNAVTARATTPEHRRPDTCLYLDEAANFLRLPGSVADMLAEARGYRTAMVIAHQELGQLPPATRAAVAANCRTKVFFTTSPDDAATLAQHTLPHLNAHDLSHLGPHQAAVRTLHGAAELPASTMRTEPLPEPVNGRARQVRKAARRFAPQPERTRRTDPRRQEHHR
ncbi:type IV secretory system conjugative DNA transfer family protein [Nocardiopsis tropica]|uniref:Type IV secretory system conjugative DNA transfer family protein n=1 Tax=Nocardiopsis tropica TaxID=109330 RepID=A0ABU7KKI4_9ACTN|nr:type IV secretory system conjugative DNA transfer family protein [Nocardiopsis umidischolae]MEE2049810.1 type IV secretory system conjugative DNA transfer family protein [Nocardiopsis umidischolae]